ncbi:hypothetical protein ACMA1I_07730 [Pontibacter sp. 13R65]|uniref:hypothetical protein n=1 Tax=Pontibacter sp. 13R65 TaxID=3127458 RepID=UPI00301DB12D
MKKSLLTVAALLFQLPLLTSVAQSPSQQMESGTQTVQAATALETDKSKGQDKQPLLLKSLSSERSVMEQDTLPLAQEFKRSYQVGAAIHMFAALSQGPMSAMDEAASGSNNHYLRSFNLYRARLLFGAQLSRKGNVFFETEINLPRPEKS